MDESKFWSMIETAWTKVRNTAKARQKLVLGQLSEDKALDLEEKIGQTVITALAEMLRELSAEHLLTFDRILEQKLHDIDREDIHERTDGSDDGFLYCRGFIVAAGREFYDAVVNRPEVAVADAECEEMCYISLHIYEEKFGEMPPSGVSRESFGNPAGWPESAEG